MFSTATAEDRHNRSSIIVYIVPAKLLAPNSIEFVEMGVTLLQGSIVITSRRCQPKSIVSAMNDTRRSYRILLIAEAANPKWGVPLGWSLYQALAKVAHVHLVTQVRNRDALVRTGLVEGKDFTSVDNEWLASPLYKLNALCGS